MSDRTILDGIRVAKPCSADWDAMKGDDRTRFCSDCGKNVYNISSMTTEEAIRLVSVPDKLPCVQFYRRSDGTILTADCPVGVARVRRSRLKRLAGLGLVGVALVATGASAVAFRRESVPTTPGFSGSVDDWIDWALVSVGLRQPHRSVTLGACVPISMPIQTQTQTQTQTPPGGLLIRGEADAGPLVAPPTPEVANP